MVLSCRRGIAGNGISSVVDGAVGTRSWLLSSAPAVADRIGAPGRTASVGLTLTDGDGCDVVVFSFDLEALTSFFDEKSLRKNPGLGFGATGSCVGGSEGTGGGTSAALAA